MTTRQMTLPDCIRLAEFAHYHQRDKAGFEYIDHPKRVLAAIQRQGAPPYVQMAAILHDVTEDTPFSCFMLSTLGVPDAAVNLVELLDRNMSRDKYYDQPEIWDGQRPDEDPNIEQKIQDFYYAEIRKDPWAVQIKLADIGDNTQPWRLSYLSTATQARLRLKYAKAVEALTGAPVLKPITDPIRRVHNHRPFWPRCNERRLPDGQLRGACLNDDGSDRH